MTYARREIPAGLIWYGRIVSAVLVLALVAIATLPTRAGWELPRDLYRMLTFSVGTCYFAWISFRPPAFLARDDGRKVLFVMIGLSLVAAVAFELSAVLA